jgi:hypothetical protein
VIINKDYKLTSDNFYTEEFEKTQIVIGNTWSMNMTHYDLWLNKSNGNFKGVAPYTIALDGTVYEHYDPKYYSKTITLEDWDEFIIPIVVENEGWLTKDYKNNELLTWCGDIYKREGGKTLNSKWRGKLEWALYNDAQLDSLVELCDTLIEKFGIKRFVSSHNTKIIDIAEKKGIYYRSNYNANYLDVSPAFNFKEFKNRIEQNGKH